MILPVGSVGSSGWHSGHTCRTQSSSLWDTSDSGMSSALPSVTLAWGTELCRHPIPVAAQKRALCVCARCWCCGFGCCEKEEPVMWAKDFSCNLCGKLIAVDYKPSAILLICNTGQQPLKRAVLHPAPQAQNPHIIEQHGMGLFKKQIGCTPGRCQEDWRDR